MLIWHAQGTLDSLSSLHTRLTSTDYPLACLPLGIGSGFPRVEVGYGLWYAEGEWQKMSLFTPLGLLWLPFLSAVSSDLGFCFLPTTQLSWLLAQVGEGERTIFLHFLSEK